MKKLFTSLFTFYCIGLGFSQSWTTTKPHIYASFNDLACPDSNTCYAVGAKGVIYKSTNGANSWDSLSPNITDDILAIHCTNNNTCFAITGRSSILKTTDGGQNWSVDSTNSNLGGTSIYFFNATTGYVTGLAEGKFLKTNDGGNSWTVQSSNLTDKYIKQVYFTSTSVGFATSQNYDRATQTSTGLIYKTTDGGLTWNQVYSLPNRGFNDIHFPTSTIGFAVGTNGTILKTGDGGQNWTLQNSNTNKDLSSLYFVDNNIGYVTGKRGTILKTNNRGINWTVLNTEKFDFFNSVNFIDQNRGYFLAGNKILKTTTGGN